MVQNYRKIHKKPEQMEKDFYRNAKICFHGVRQIPGAFTAVQHDSLFAENCSLGICKKIANLSPTSASLDDSRYSDVANLCVKKPIGIFYRDQPVPGIEMTQDISFQLVDALI